MNKVYILGGYQTDFERNWHKEGKNYKALLRECFEGLLNNTPITRKEIEKLKIDNRIECFVGNFISECFLEQGHIGALLTNVDDIFVGMPSARYEAACASGSVALSAAISKIKAGLIDAAFVFGFELMKTVDSKTCGDILGKAAIYEIESRGIEYPFPKLFGNLVDEILKKYGISEAKLMDSLAKISEINYSNAKKNKNAQTRNWFMNYEHARHRGNKYNLSIGGKLATTDCSQVTDGACSLIMVSEKYLKECLNLDVNSYPIIKAMSCRVAPMSFKKKIDDNKNSKFVLPWTRQTIVDVYDEANMTVDDIDFFETHDCFTSSEYAAISCFGITEPGHEYEAIDKGVISLRGKKPINPSGGLIGVGHPVGCTGVRMMLDLYKQVTNQAGDYQVKNARNGMMLNIGGTATTNYAFIVGIDKKVSDK